MLTRTETPLQADGRHPNSVGGRARVSLTLQSRADFSRDGLFTCVGCQVQEIRRAGRQVPAVFRKRQRMGRLHLVLIALAQGGLGGIVPGRTAHDQTLQIPSPAYTDIPRKLIVAKRLAQCLNPALPSGVHQRALDVYSHILGTIGVSLLQPA